tara:strand:+ start:1632 stop:2588 length:957 start_codon:yes stop_codon:yes gene_type:complete
MIDINATVLHPRFGEVLRGRNAQDFYGQLNRLKRLDASKLTSQQVDDRFRRAFNGYITRSIIMGSNGVWRARVNAIGKSFDDASDLWFPPTAAVRHRGRFNEADQSLFYCSNKISSAVEEMRPSTGDIITILVAGAKSPGANITVAHVGVHRAISEPEVINDMGGGLRAVEDWVAHLEKMRIRARWLALDDFLTDISTSVYTDSERDWRYKLTNALARMLLEPEGIEGIIYPSVASDMTAFNICFSPKQADQHFYPFEAWEIQVIAPPLEGESSVAKFLRHGVVGDSGKITWSASSQGFSKNEILGSIGRSVAARRAI